MTSEAAHIVASLSWVYLGSREGAGNVIRHESKPQKRTNILEGGTKCDLQTENTPLLWPFSYSSLIIKINPCDSSAGSGVLTFNGDNCQQVLMLVPSNQKKAKTLFPRKENNLTLNVCVCVCGSTAPV